MLCYNCWHITNCFGSAGKVAIMKRSSLRNRRFDCSYFIIGSALVLLTVLGLFHYLNRHVYVVLIGDREAGIVEDVRDIEGFIDQVTEEYSELYGMELEFSKEVTLSRESRPDCEPDSEAAQRLIKQQAAFLTEAYMVQVDGKPFVPVACESDLERIIQSLKEEFFGEDEGDSARVIEFEVAENLSLKDIKVDPRYLFTANEAVSLLKAGASENPLMADARLEKAYRNSMHHPTIVEHEYNSAPSFEGVAKAGLASKVLNPAAGEVVLSVKTLEEITVTEKIPYKTEYIYDDEMYTSEQEVKEPGSEGKKEIVYLVEKENGQEVERESISEEVIKEPEPRVEILGRKATPSSGSGQFVWPVQGKGVVYNGFSSRHTGIDIHIDHGTNVLAADDGVVTYEGYGDTQGKYLIIRHGEYWTLYLHNSAHLVSEGDRVKRGQPIARVGTTGRAFGPHLHFEIRVDDGTREWNSYYQHKPVDPKQYFNRR